MSKMEMLATSKVVMLTKSRIVMLTKSKEVMLDRSYGRLHKAVVAYPVQHIIDLISKPIQLPI